MRACVRVCNYLSEERVCGRPQSQSSVTADLQSRTLSETPDGYCHAASALEREGRGERKGGEEGREGGRGGREGRREGGREGEGREGGWKEGVC